MQCKDLEGLRELGFNLEPAVKRGRNKLPLANKVGLSCEFSQRTAWDRSYGWLMGRGGGDPWKPHEGLNVEERKRRSQGKYAF